MGFSRQEYQSGLPFPSPGELLDPGIEPRSLTLQADRYFTNWAMQEVRAFYFLWYVQTFVNRCTKNYGNIIFQSFLKKFMLKVSILIIIYFFSYIHSLPLAALFYAPGGWSLQLYHLDSCLLSPVGLTKRTEGNRMTEGMGYLFSSL